MITIAKENSLNIYIHPEDRVLLEKYSRDTGQSMSKILTHFIQLHLTKPIEVIRYYTIKLTQMQSELRKRNLELEFNIKKTKPKNLGEKRSDDPKPDCKAIK